MAKGDEPWAVDDILERVSAHILDFEPGQGWAYSNIGDLFIRQLIEEACGQSLEIAMQELVFGPLDIHSVTLATHHDDLTAAAWGNRHGYHPGWVYHGLLLGTAADAARFLHGLMMGQLLTPDLLNTMKHQHPLGGVIPDRPWQTAGYGLGLMSGKMLKAGSAIGHSGCGPNSVSAVYHFPDCAPSCTVAAFVEGENEGICEYAAAHLADQ